MVLRYTHLPQEVFLYLATQAHFQLNEDKFCFTFENPRKVSREAGPIRELRRSLEERGEERAGGWTMDKGQGGAREGRKKRKKGKRKERKEKKEQKSVKEFLIPRMCRAVISNSFSSFLLDGRRS